MTALLFALWLVCVAQYVLVVVALHTGKPRWVSNAIGLFLVEMYRQAWQEEDYEVERSQRD